MRREKGSCSSEQNPLGHNQDKIKGRPEQSGRICRIHAVKREPTLLFLGKTSSHTVPTSLTQLHASDVPIRSVPADLSERRIFRGAQAEPPEELRWFRPTRLPVLEPWPSLRRTETFRPFHTPAARQDLHRPVDAAAPLPKASLPEDEDHVS